LPKIKELNQEFAMLLAKKKSAYGKYKAAKEEMKDMTEAKRNIDMFLEFAESKNVGKASAEPRDGEGFMDIPDEMGEEMPFK